jgi:hypothetical protein
MYRFSRSIYRELAPLILDDPENPTGQEARDSLLRASEATIERLAFDPDFAAPARSLFEQVRWRFDFADQEKVRRVIESRLALAREYLKSLSSEELSSLGRRCVAYRRDGTPCQRPPTPGSHHCPSHRHLAEPLVEAGVS